MTALVIFLLVVGFVFVIKEIWSNRWITPHQPFPPEWRTILLEKVPFYAALSGEEKKRFEFKVHEFLLNCRITGIEVSVDTTDKLLVAASAVIPIFAFPGWRYSNLYEVLLYPDEFNHQFETSGSERDILGMVGTGYMNGKMILSKPALHQGFANSSDKKNTAIHEFVHLIDQSDGVTDGIPELLIERQYAIPWLDLINKEIEAIYNKRSDINPYGGTNRGEFFSVASEYFFERPELLAEKHPELYRMLEKIFNQNMLSRNLKKKRRHISGNSPCPCGSGKQFKNCCGKVHYQ